MMMIIVFDVICGGGDGDVLALVVPPPLVVVVIAVVLWVFVGVVASMVLPRSEYFTQGQQQQVAVIFIHPL